MVNSNSDNSAPMRISDLVSAWDISTIELALLSESHEAARIRAPDPLFIDRLRGAVGNVLLRAASPQARRRQPCPWDPPCTLDVFFGRRKLTAGLDLPKPFVMGVEADGDDPSVWHLTVTIFGTAGDWAPALADALSQSLTEGIHPPRDRRGPPDRFTVMDRTLIANPPALAPSAAPADALLTFATPLVQDRQGAPLLDVGALLTGLGNRISGLARWMDLQLDADWSSLREEARSRPWHADAMTPITLERGSGFSKTGVLKGFSGSLLIRELGDDLLTLLTLGTTCHAGARAALGFGRYSLLIVDRDSWPDHRA